MQRFPGISSTLSSRMASSYVVTRGTSESAASRMRMRLSWESSRMEENWRNEMSSSRSCCSESTESDTVCFAVSCVMW